ncbi:type 4b pilus protein PilO2 [Pseudomonas sp. 21LCFQ02]|uniref:type 4b pilus protein PilO2 n=1 Tax=Pseudomonas sp. 21LCFQ02 TaxID=2957505 RepID=UPI00209BB46B|nr:type 4b pilus protein PilO2 [Pseudomonas sp. 21LCFQ02]MCO8166174.1 type 4b pilus protein PilO2 [Pseudomonas sp. 21LCFQ02]
MKELIIREVGGERCVVYGLDWAPLIGNKLDRQSLAHARNLKATHHVPAVEYSSSVGTAKLPSVKKTGKGRAVYSAGAIVALKHPTSAYLGVISIEEALVWVIATHNGSVIKGTDTLCSPEEADQLVASVRARYPQISDLEDTDVQSYLNERTQLKAVRYGVDAVPGPLKILIIAVLGLLIANFAWDQGKRLIQSYTRSHADTQQIDATQEWTAALDIWAESTLMDGPRGFADLFEAMMHLPLEVGNWSLKRVQCDNANQRNWTCRADYARGVIATNESFLSSLRPDWKWKTRWVDLDNAQVSWQVPGTRHPLSRKALPALTTFSLDYISRLQDVSKAYSLIEVKPPAAVTIPAPVINDGQGKVALELPQGIRLPNVMTFSIKGPLRSLAAFPLNDSTRISRLQFDVERNEARPDLRNSALFGEIKGDYYVQ